jgi:hypothetical protein
MSKFGFRTFLDDGPFVLLIMLAALTSAAFEAAAVIAVLPASVPSAYASLALPAKPSAVVAARPTPTASSTRFAPQLVARLGR